MKKLIVQFLVVLMLFGLVNLGSLLVRSDDLFTPDVPDAMTRWGFPLLVYQHGGPVALDYFSSIALSLDALVGLIVALLVVACSGSICHDVLRTLGFETRDV
ncbi:MAG: hypothetical protein U1F83_19825 [Verrucomicrobiota bacterium]